MGRKKKRTLSSPPIAANEGIRAFSWIRNVLIEIVSRS